MRDKPLYFSEYSVLTSESKRAQRTAIPFIDDGPELPPQQMALSGPAAHGPTVYL